MKNKHTAESPQDKTALRQRLWRRLRAPFITAWGMISGKGITKRWLFNTFIIAAALMLSVVVVLSFLARKYYYDSIEQGLMQRSSVTISYFSDTVGSGINSGNSAEFYDAAQSFVESFEGRDKMELQFLNANGDIIVSSTGFPAAHEESLADYNNAVQSKRGVGSWSGVNSNGEKVLAVSRLISRRTGSSAGAVRFVVSLEAADQLVLTLTVSLFGIVGLVLFFMLISGSYFVSSIVAPVKEISDSAREIAKGNFEIRVKAAHEDEIGALADSINSMAGELADSERVKNDFISSVSHELRTPLTAIRGWGETLRDVGAEDGELMEKGMNVIISETERLSGLVEDLLDFSRIQSGRMKMDFGRLDMIAEAADCACLFDEQCAQENKTLTFNAPETVSTVIGDGGRIRQVLINIIENAIKYTDPGGHITVTVAGQAETVSVCVEDDGCGIAASEINRVSRRFYKANVSRRGFGIGLAVAEEIIMLHQGILGIESTEGVGTRVTVTLPVEGKFDYDAASVQEGR